MVSSLTSWSAAASITDSWMGGPPDANLQALLLTCIGGSPDVQVGRATLPAHSVWGGRPMS